jgi:hypothetical protein
MVRARILRRELIMKILKVILSIIKIIVFILFLGIAMGFIYGLFCILVLGLMG